MFNSIKLFWVFAIIGSTTMATPLKTTTSLPLTGSDILNAGALLKNQGKTEDFIAFIKNLDVFPDHENPKEIPQIENRSIKKSFYIAPFFQASEERVAVGGQEIADLGLTIFSEAYDLLESFDYELLKINQLKKEIATKNNTLQNFRAMLPDISDELTKQTAVEVIAGIENEITSFTKRVETLEQQATNGISATSLGLRQQVASQIQLKLAFLGVTVTKEEDEQLHSSNAADMQNGLSTLIARAAQEGQFGYRTATYEAGYTKQQRDWIAIYRAIRPDISVSSLSTNAVYVRPTALSAKNTASNSIFFIGKDKIVSGARMILGVNAGSQGACGNTHSCNVTLEYTWLGASMAKTAASGAIVMPVYFEADVSIMQPDFEGTVTCDLKNGFSANGRSDVKDGGIIYDGDVTNKIDYDAFENGGCNYQIIKGDAQSAAYYTIKNIYDRYMTLKMQRATKSRNEKDRYKSYVDKELAYHASNSQNTNFDFYSLNTWTTALGAPWGTLASFVVGSGRSFYWHTRIEDSTTQETIKFSTSIKEGNTHKTERLAFDGFTLLCWKNIGAGLSLAACPSVKHTEYQKSADTDLGKNQHLCGNAGTSTQCLERAKEEARSPKTDSNGVINPWA